MAVIQSGATSDQLTVDPTSKAARITPYDTGGNALNIVPTGAFSMYIPIERITAAIAANSYLFAMRNAATKTVYIRNIEIVTAFDGTAAAATSLQLELMRFAAATPTGGTAVTVANISKQRNTLAASALTDVRFGNAAALSVTSVTFETPFYSIALPRSVTNGVVRTGINFQAYQFGAFVLAANEGLILKNISATVIGDSISGSITWEEA